MAVRERCGMVAKWATGRALLMSKDEEADVEQIALLHTPSGHSVLLGQLALSQGESLTQPQLVRLLDGSCNWCGNSTVSRGDWWTDASTVVG